MTLFWPKVKKNRSGDWEIVCTRFSADELERVWQGEVKGRKNDYGGRDDKYGILELNFVSPPSCIDNIEEGYYEYDEWPNTVPGLSQHVSGPVTYVAQHMGGSGDTQYTFIKALIDIETGLDDLGYYLGKDWSWVTKKVEGTLNTYRSVKVPTLCPQQYWDQLLPMTLKVDMILGEGTILEEDLVKLSNDTRWIYDRICEGR
jgi:hypothetical protein